MKRARFSILLVLGLLVGFPLKVCYGQNEQGTGMRRVVNKVVPAYPQVARSMNLSGTVRLEVLVQTNGNVKSAQVKGGNPLFAQSAQSAIREWKWEKAERESTELVEFHFTP